MRHLAWTAIVIAALLLAGCVERKLMVITEPPAAHVYVDGDYVGESPVSVPFTHYGTREVHVIKPEEGEADAKVLYQSQRRLVDLRPPFYEIFPFDFISEVLYPGTLVDSHLEVFRLREAGTDQDAFLERANYHRALMRALESAPAATPTADE